MRVEEEARRRHEAEEAQIRRTQGGPLPLCAGEDQAKRAVSQASAREDYEKYTVNVHYSSICKYANEDRVLNQ